MEPKKIKEVYNKKIKEKYKGDYEQGRWFANSLSRTGYEMTLESIKYHLLKNDYPVKNFLELGPGTGTWTRLFINKYSEANFDLVDISSEMLNLAKNSLSKYHANINYFEKDFLLFKSRKKYDLFFSCRALEYLSDKELAVQKIAELLQSGGQGFIITKTPKYLRAKLLGRKISELHRGQILPRKLKKLLKKAGFKNLEIYPATMIFPLLRSAKINKLLHKIFYKHKLNCISKFFAESYCVKFTKL